MFTAKARKRALIALALGIVSIAPAAMKTSDVEAAASSSESCLPSALKSRLGEVRSKFGAVRVVSTYRPGAVIAGSGRMSHHANCEAVDFVPPAGKYSQVVAWLQSHHGGGVGTYTCMDHVHIDTGPQMHWSKCR